MGKYYVHWLHAKDVRGQYWETIDCIDESLTAAELCMYYYDWVCDDGESILLEDSETGEIIAEWIYHLARAIEIANELRKVIWTDTYLDNENYHTKVWTLLAEFCELAALENEWKEVSKENYEDMKSIALEAADRLDVVI